MIERSSSGALVVHPKVYRMMRNAATLFEELGETAYKAFVNDTFELAMARTILSDWRRTIILGRGQA